MNQKYNMNIVGEKYTDNANREFTVIKMYKIKGKRGFMNTVYDIQYTETNYILKQVRRQEIQNGETEDHYAPTVAGVGAKGDIFVPHDKTKIERYMYETWKNMLYRCYDEKQSSYKWYGAKGIKVCDRWLRFDWFFEDCTKLKGYDKESILAGKLDLDKDINGGNIYSPETCQFVTKSENRKEAADRRWHKTQQ